MKNALQAVDGRQSLSFILEPTTEEVTGTSGSLKIGDIVVVTAKATASSAFKETQVNEFFICNKETTLASGDKCLKCTPYFCGQAKDKSLSASKNTTDVTTDWDAMQNNQTDGIVSMSGSISGSNMLQGLTTENALAIIKSRFGSITEVDKSGTMTRKDANTTEKDILMIIWNGRDAKIGDYLDIDIVPVLFTSLNKGGSYGSSQTFDCDFTGNATDEHGYLKGAYQVENVAGLIPEFARPSITG